MNKPIFNTFVYFHNYISKESSARTMETVEKIRLLLDHNVTAQSALDFTATILETSTDGNSYHLSGNPIKGTFFSPFPCLFS